MKNVGNWVISWIAILIRYSVKKTYASNWSEMSQNIIILTLLKYRDSAYIQFIWYYSVSLVQEVSFSKSSYGITVELCILPQYKHHVFFLNKYQITNFQALLNSTNSWSVGSEELPVALYRIAEGGRQLRSCPPCML